MKVDGLVPFPENYLFAEKESPGIPATTSDLADSPGVALAGDAFDKGITQRLSQHLAELPDIRQDRVEQLRTAIAEGQYPLSNERIADAMLRDLLH